MNKKACCLLLAALILLSGCGVSKQSVPIESDHPEEQSSTAKSEDSDRKGDLFSWIGKKKKPTEETIRSDLEKEGLYGLSEPYRIDEFSVTKSKTDEDGGTYQAWVTFRSVSDKDSIQREYEVFYELYDEGWLLESFSPYKEESWLLRPTRGLTEDELLSYLGDKVYSWEFESNEVDLDAKTQDVRINFIEVHEYCILRKQMIINLCYSDTLFGFPIDEPDWVSSVPPYEEILETEWRFAGNYQIGDDPDRIIHLEPQVAREVLLTWKPNSSISAEYSLFDVSDYTTSQIFVNLYGGDASSGGYTAKYENSCHQDLQLLASDPFYGGAHYLIFYDHIFYGCDYTIDYANRNYIIRMGDELHYIH